MSSTVVPAARAAGPLPVPALAGAPAAASAPPGRPGLGGLLDALGRIVADPPALPSVQQRVAAMLRRIDLDADPIVIYVRGTNERDLRPEIRAAFERVLPGATVHQVEYEASWRFADSVPDGVAVLRGVLEAIRRRRPGARVLVAGESQGAWVAATVLADPAMSRIVARAVLWGAPAAAPVDFADGHDPRVRELNNRGDIVTMDLGARANGMLVAAIDRLARRDLAGGLLPILRYAVTHPAVLGALIAAQLWRVPVIGSRFPSPHGYDFVAGVQFLRGGRGPT